MDQQTDLNSARRDDLPAMAGGLPRLARLALGATIVLLPWRARVVLVNRAQPPIYGEYTHFVLTASDVFLLLTLLLWLGSLLIRPRRVALGPLFLSLPLAAVTGLGLVSAIFSVDPLLSLYHVVRLLLLGAFALFVANEITRLSQVIWPVALQVAIQAVVGVAQVLLQRSLGLTALGEWELNPAWSGVSIVWAEGVRSLRAYGLTDHPNILGGCLALGLLVIAAWHVGAPVRWRAPAGGLVGLGALGLLLTFSRAAWLATIGGGVLSLLMLWVAGWRRALWDWLGLAGAALLVVLPVAIQMAPYLGARLNQGNSFVAVMTENRSLVERDTLVEAANTLFAEHALVGVGLGAFPVALRARFPDFPFHYQPPHIVLLSVAAEAGILAALCFGVVLVAPWLALWLNRRRLQLTPALIGVSGALLAVTIIGFFDYYPWLLPAGRLWQWFLWGLWAAFYAQARRGGNGAPATNPTSAAGQAGTTTALGMSRHG